MFGRNKHTGEPNRLRFLVYHFPVLIYSVTGGINYCPVQRLADSGGTGLPFLAAVSATLAVAHGLALRLKGPAE